jgi:small-conductance mechanosensitive channel
LSWSSAPGLWSGAILNVAPAPIASTWIPEGLRQFWNFEVISIRNEPLTVGVIVVALLLLILGFWISRLLSQGVVLLLSRHFHSEPGSLLAVRTLAFYGLFAFFAVTSLALVNFPMTAFTIVGGAFAIGVGFGSQNIMNNFISGLILNVERPVRVGDFVKVENVHGTIERIGGRSTLIRAANNAQVIVPNSFLLENRVMNFTLTDDIVRLELPVGVAYGSPTREVEKIMLEALAEHSRVLAEQEPGVLFDEFGDSSLLFVAYFWVRARSQLEQKEILSALRFRIDERFREAGIAIAHPQRDLHVDVTRPLDVRVMGPDRAFPPTPGSGSLPRS